MYIRIRTSTALLVLALFAFAVRQEAGASEHDSRLYGLASSPVEEYYITCDPDSFALIYSTPHEDIYIPATVTHRDKTWTNVQLRLRGDSSRDFPKKSLKLKSDEPFANGRDVLNFNAEYLDKSFLNSYLSSRLFRAMGYPCFTAEPVRVYLNGSFLGLYVGIENMDEDFLVGQGLSPDGSLYKATYDGACLSLEEDIHALWEKKANEGTDWADLETLIRDLNTVPDSAYYDFVRRTFDYDNMVSIIALNILISNGSTYYHNYYMYRNPADNKWTMMPWDLDKTFTAYGHDFPYQRSTAAHPDNPFHERAIMDKRIFADIHERIRELYATLFTPEFLNPIIDSMSVALEPSVAQDTSDQNATVDEWHERLDKLKSYITSRPQRVEWQIAHHPQTFHVVSTSGLHTLPLHLRWYQATDPDGDPLTYTVRISTQQHFPQDRTIVYSGITDTTFAVDSLPDEGRYYWTVAATDGTTGTDGYSKLHSFIFHKGSPLPAVVQDTLILTAEGSPYVADSDIVVGNGAWLLAEPGAEIHLPEGANITVFGGVELEGTREQPVRIRTMSNSRFWGHVLFKPGSRPSALRFVELNHGTRADMASEPWAGKIHADSSNLILDNVEFINCYRGVWSQNSTLMMSHCRFPGGNFGELVHITGGTAFVSDCEFHNVGSWGLAAPSDAIDLDAVPQAILQYNRIYDVEDDGIDIGSSNVSLIGNEIYRCGDKGISVGEGSQVAIEGTVAGSCAYGIAVKENSTASVDRCTLYSNAEALGVYNGGVVTVGNTIFAHSTAASVFVQDAAAPAIRYSLSTTDDLPGIGNLRADPMFVDAPSGDFRLLPSSPCIDAGDPASPTDPDGTRADIGARFYNKIVATTTVVINEISYNPADDADTDDWVELYNPGDEPVNISEWVFKDEDDSHIFTFPSSLVIAPKGYLVVCTDTVKFRQFFPDVHPVIGNTGFGLAGGGELIRLYNRSGEIVDSLTYDDVDPWPTEPDGDGPTLELVSAELDNALGQSWKASTVKSGTPGRRNSTSTSGVGPVDNTQLFFISQNYPNPFADRTLIDCILLRPAHVTVEVYDVLGKPVMTVFDGARSSGAFTVEFDATALPPGQYLYGLRVNGELVVVKSAVVIR